MSPHGCDSAYGSGRMRFATEKKDTSQNKCIRLVPAVVKFERFLLGKNTSNKIRFMRWTLDSQFYSHRTLNLINGWFLSWKARKRATLARMISVIGWTCCTNTCEYQTLFSSSKQSRKWTQKLCSAKGCTRAGSRGSTATSGGRRARRDGIDSGCRWLASKQMISVSADPATWAASVDPRTVRCLCLPSAAGLQSGMLGESHRRGMSKLVGVMTNISIFNRCNCNCLSAVFLMTAWWILACSG